MDITKLLGLMGNLGNSSDSPREQEGGNAENQNTSMAELLRSLLGTPNQADSSPNGTIPSSGSLQSIIGALSSGNLEALTSQGISLQNLQSLMGNLPLLLAQHPELMGLVTQFMAKPESAKIVETLSKANSSQEDN